MKIQAIKWLGGAASALSSMLSMTCPLCIPGGAALIMSLGVAMSTEFIQGALVILLVVSIGSLYWAARLHRQFWVVAVGTAAGALIYFGRYVLPNTALVSAGAFLLIGTSVINLRLKRGTRCRCQHTTA